MSEETVAPESVPLSESEVPTSDLPGGSDTPETVVESDEQKNERVQREAAEKAEKRARGVQKRIDELTADKHAERKRAEELSRQNAELLAMLKGGKPQPVSDGEPKREQFDDYENFVVARAEFRAEQKAKSIAEQQAREFRESQERQSKAQSEHAVMREYLNRQKEVAKTIPDFTETMADAEVEVPTSVFEMIKRMPDGPLIAYHMAKNEALAKQFYDNSPEMHGILLGQLSATLKASTQVSKAPPPGKPVKSKPGSSDDPPDNPDEYQAWATKHMR